MGGEPISASGATAGGFGSEQPNGIGKPDGSGNGNAGFIDPVTARDTGATLSTSPAPTDERGSPPGSVAGDGHPANSTKRPRGRPRKDGTAPQSRAEPAKTAEPRNLNINGIDKVLFSVHAILAATVACPELAIDEKEAKDLGKAI